MRSLLFLALAISGLIFLPSFGSGEFLTSLRYGTLCLVALSIAILISQQTISFKRLTKSDLITAITLGIAFAVIKIIALEQLFELSQESSTVFSKSQSHLIVLSITSLILVSFTEEIIFRGLLFEDIKKVAGTVIASVLTVILFVAVHYRINDALIVYLSFNALGGIIYTLLRIKTDSVVAPILAHTSANIMVFIITS